MVMGGEPAEARDAGGPPVAKVEDENRPPAWRNGVAPEDDAYVERSLTRFAEAAASRPNPPPKIPEELEGVLREIAAVGVPYYGWGALKELLTARMAEAVESLEREAGFQRTNGGKDYTQRRDELVAALRRFEAAPFTLQRLAEVLQDPRRQYSSTHKLINGLERLLAVSSTLTVQLRRKDFVVARATAMMAMVAASDTAISNGDTRGQTTAIPATSQKSHENASSGSGAGNVGGGGGDAPAVAVAVAAKLVEQEGAARVPIDEDKPMEHARSAEGWGGLEESSAGDLQGEPGRERQRKRLKVEAFQHKEHHQVMSE